MWSCGHVAMWPCGHVAGCDVYTSGVSVTVGTRVGSYELVASIGVGGMGEVYRARDLRLQREVAIKFLPEAFRADGDRLARFRREAQVLASLNDPHIADVYGFEEHDGAPFLVMEFVEGGTLADKIGAGALPFAEAIAIALQVADALEAAHEKGIVHRDLKPGNIGFTTDGQVKVLDFGLAKAFEAPQSPELSFSPTLSLAATQAGVLLGTAAYMSPPGGHELFYIDATGFLTTVPIEVSGSVLKEGTT